MSFKAGRHVDEERRKRYYDLLFDEINSILRKHDLTQRDKNFLIQTLKEIMGRVEHHELGPGCPATDIDFLETSYGKIVALVLKCRLEKHATDYERDKALQVSKALNVPFFIEYVEIDEKQRTVGKRRHIEWVNEAITLKDVNKEKWQQFHLLIRRPASRHTLLKFFEKLEGYNECA